MTSSLVTSEGVGDLGERKAAVDHGPQARRLSSLHEVDLLAPMADDQTLESGLFRQRC
jgi:hypothetical protein